MLAFNRNYFGLALTIFIIEVLIALHVHDHLIRPYVGDILVVVLMYCFFRSFLKLPVFTVALFVLCFAFAIEGLQFLNVVDQLGLGDSKLARTVLGTSFSWMDLLLYVIGIGIVVLVEKRFTKREHDKVCRSRLDKNI